jgi:hypothetical protein
MVYPCTEEHQIVDAISLYASSGISKGEAVVLVLTYPHCEQVQERLRTEGHDLQRLKKSGQFICADAARTLGAFMVGSAPDETRFLYVIGDMIGRAKTSGGKTPRTVRAFGEMVSLLFGTNPSAALRLEELWNEVIRTEKMCLLCTYHLGERDQTLSEDLYAAHSHCVA